MKNEEAIAYANDWLKDEYALCEDDKEVLRMAIEALQAQTDGDLISRQDAIDALMNDPDWADAIPTIKSIPSAEPKTGEWKQISPARIYECSECGQMVKTGNIGAYKFCHGCGARMNGGEEE